MPKKSRNKKAQTLLKVNFYYKGSGRGKHIIGKIARDDNGNPILASK